MAKGNILSDTFEQLAELGASTAKQTVKSVAQIVNPFSKNESKPHSPEVNRGKDHTPLDFKKLQNKFQDKDKLQAESLKNRLFQMVRREDEKIIERKDMEEGQKRDKKNTMSRRKRKEQQQKNQNQESGMPTGKAKRGTMSQKIFQNSNTSKTNRHLENNNGV